VHDALRVLRRARRVEDEGRIVYGCVGGCAVRLPEHRLIEVGDLAFLVHGLDLGAAARVGEEQPRPRVTDTEVEILRPQHLGARNRHGAGLQPREHHSVPLRRLPDQHEHAVAGCDAADP
jgi:hypothetical protein